MKHIKIIAVAFIILLLALSACGGGDEGAEPTVEEGATPVSGEQVSSPTNAPAAEEPAATTSDDKAATSSEEQEATPVPSEEELDLPEVTSGLEGLDSYKSVFTMKFVGTDDSGQEVEASWETQEDFTREPKAQRILMTTSDSSEEVLGQTGFFGMITIGDTNYILSEDADGNRTCISMSSGEESDTGQGLFTPDMMGSISGAKYVGRDTVNGISTKHYKWDEQGAAVFGFTSASGEVWVAADGEYVVRYISQATGKGTLFGNTEREGTITFDYNLTEVNTSFTIEPPAECESAATDIPLMADAQDKATFGEMITYTSPSAFADVVEFYKTEMVASGWEISGEPMEMEGFATLDFAMDGRTAQVIITYDADAQTSSVMITAGGE